MKTIQFNTWLKLSLFNLIIVGIIGVIMRYKIIFELPIFSQKNLQHAHSHFAFSGWISQTIIVFMVWFLHKNKFIKNEKAYQLILIFNAIAAYGMLVSFSLFGYNFISIFFSSLAVFLTFVFTYFFYINSQKIVIKPISLKWFYAALLFNLLSAIGTFALAYMMATKHLVQHVYLASVYWYLHFQYNGWFFFACVGLLLTEIKILANHKKQLNTIFWLLFISCFPAYMLSILWVNLPQILFIVTAISSIVQLVAWLKFVKLIKNYFTVLKLQTNKFISLLLIVLSAAITLKYVLQLGSTFPEVSTLAFGFRPIVIAYLHLVLLAIISVFLIYFMHLKQLFTGIKSAVFTTILLVIGFYFNELILAIQGIASFVYFIVPYAQELLLFIALFVVLMLVKLLLPFF